MGNLSRDARLPAPVSGSYSEIRLADDRNIDAISGWDDFQTNDKMVLLNLPWCGTEKEALSAANMSLSTWEVHKRKNPLLKSAIAQRKALIPTFIRMASQDLLAKGVFYLHRMLDDDEVETKDKLAVIDRIMKLSNFGKPTEQPAPMPQVNNFIQFAGSKSAPIDESIPVEADVVD